MGNKSWRITDEQIFFDQANKYLEHHLMNFIENLDQNIRSKEKANDIWKKYRIYQKRCDNSYYIDDIKFKIKDMLEICLEDVDNWVRFSNDINSSLNEIMLRIIINSQFNCSYVSNLYLSKNPNLTEEFVEDCIYVSSDLFRFDEWDDIHVDAVTLAASLCEVEYCSPTLLELYDKDRLSNKIIPIKLDLQEFCCNCKNTVFASKYYSYLNMVEIEKLKGKKKHY